MYSDQLTDELEKLKAENKPAAMAVVVRREAPSSGKPGDKAIITTDGDVKGWIGGGCTKGIVIKEALESINQGSPRLVRILPADNLSDAAGVKNYKMTCMSGGSVEVYIEPIMQTTQLYIFGRSHIAKALCQLANASGYKVHMVSDLADDGMFESASSISTLKDFDKDKQLNNDYVVVCTQGEDDASSLATAINANPKYLGFVSSRKKANSLFLGLKRDGVPFETLSKIKTPAGIDINAKTPEEVAVSILAEIIQLKRSDDNGGQNDVIGESDQLQEDLYINPVCKIPVQKSTAKYVVEHKGESVYFCCDGCKESFEKEPEVYMS
ncbi:MAG: XdhC family protein [Bacteroidota bacterium]